MCSQTFKRRCRSDCIGGLVQVYVFEQEARLCAGQQNNTVVSTRRGKGPSLQALGEQVKAAVAPVRAFNEVATVTFVHKDVAAERILR